MSTHDDAGSQAQPAGEQPAATALWHFLHGAMAFNEAAPWDVVPPGIPLELEIPPGTDGALAVVAPVAARFAPDGSVREAEEVELGFAAAALTAVTEFVQRRGEQVAAWGVVHDEIEHGEGDHRYVLARVTFPARLAHTAEDAEWLRERRRGFETTPPDQRERLEAVYSVRQKILELPESNAALIRLTWSFFRYAGPVYAAQGHAREQALTRFMDWGMFFMPIPPEGRTLAERLLELYHERLSEEDRVFWERFCRPRYVWAEITQAYPGGGIVVRDNISGDTLFVRDLASSYRLPAGRSFMGPLFSVSPDHWVLDTVLPVDLISRYPADGGPKGSGAEMAPAFEVIAGASPGWIDALDLEWIEESYGTFREALPELPSFEEMAGDVAGAASPDDAAAAVVGRVSWWTAEEPEIYRRFVSRLWALQGGSAAVEV